MERNDLPFGTISELAPRIAGKELSPVELIRIVLQRIETWNGTLNAYITVMAEEALESARQAEQEIVSGRYRGPLHGIPVGLKDLFATRGVPTTSGSGMLRDFRPPEDAAAVVRLKEAGAVITGKLNMHEFALGATNENPHFGAARNPWDTTRVTGGSSGGSGAAVAAGLCIAALGSDTGGSIRTPSAFCGIVGFKPTFGLVSKHGVTPLSWSLDHVGPMTRSVQDAAIVLETIAGYDPRDPSSVHRAFESYRAYTEKEIRGLRVGILNDPYYFENLDQEIERAVQRAVGHLEASGAAVTEIKVPELSLAMYAELVILSAEASAYHHNTLLTRAKEYGDDVRVLLQGGELLTAVQYLKAQQARRVIQEAFHRVFQQVDVLVAPTVPLVAPKIGETQFIANGRTAGETVTMACVRYAAPCNLAGLPSLSVPVGTVGPHQLPVAMQLIGAPFADGMVLQAGAAYERAAGFPFHAPVG
jgi:aspartyl-tRNA(Asn)/glutamyl-tRNA(Gln) amidotransferase subunit A